MISASLDASALLSSLEALHEAAADWREPFEEMGQAVREDYASKFARGGPGWPKPKSGGKPGVKTGALRESFVSPGAPGNVTEIERDEARFGSDLDYAEAFQDRAAVARPPAPALRRDLTATAREHIASALEGVL